jgi:general stress protein 26
MEQDMANDNTANDIQRERDEDTIYFLTDARRHKDEEIARDPHVNLAFADPGSQKYVAL